MGGWRCKVAGGPPHHRQDGMDGMGGMGGMDGSDGFRARCHAIAFMRDLDDTDSLADRCPT